jgi:ribosomal protein S27AE
MSALWRTDDRCPCCGTCLQLADTPAAVTFDCGACGWTLTADLATPGGPR